MRGLVLILALCAAPVEADTLVAARMIRSQAVIGPADLALSDADTPGALSEPDAALGMEARVMLYAGRPIRPGDVGPPALIERNQTVTLRYVRGGLNITAEARALGRAAAGESLRVMNLDSRNTVTGLVTDTGEVVAGGSAFD